VSDWDRTWDARHAGHTTDRNRAGRRRCLTCDGHYTVDHAAVARAIAGDPPANLTRAERRAAVLILKAAGLSGTQVAARVGCAERTVWRILSHSREQVTA